MAVLRLLLWCDQNADLGAKLPLLATYLGHVGLASSQRYLQLTQDLMGEITRRHQARFGYLIQNGGFSINDRRPLTLFSRSLSLISRAGAGARRIHTRATGNQLDSVFHLCPYA